MKYVYGLFAAVLVIALYFHAPWQAYTGFAVLVYVVALAHVIGYHISRRQDHRYLIKDIMHVLNEDRRSGGSGRMTLTELATFVRDRRYELLNGNDALNDRGHYMPKLRRVKKAFDALAAQDDRIAQLTHSYPPKEYHTYGFLTAQG